ncbi:5511_t:CDS:10 [Dentiscutata heterogama]|uniref:5511_t:CDS:1 n=1 Tax=Dentiscutata heterogama TaxID=1316150 RepID=A0ACA9L6I3_9GLOM|nr:5511_t:CDS:10 [Dentiscutata heterogama]
MYNYVVTAHKPSSVVSATRGSISSPDETNLVLNKFSRIEIYTLVPGGLKSFKDVPVYGRIAAMQIYRPRGRDTDLLFVATDQQQYFVISYDEKQHQLITETKGNMELRVGQVPHTGMMSALDPYCRLIGLIAYQEIPTLAILYADVHNHVSIKIYFIKIKEKEFAPGPLFKEELDDTTEFLIAVPKGGFLAVASKHITYYDNNFKSRTILLKHKTAMRGVAAVDDDGSRYLLGDIFGMLYLLIIPDIGDLYTHTLGKISVPQCLLYLDHSYVFVGSHFGDSQLIRLRQTPNEQGVLLDVLDTFINLSPIVDFCVVNLERQGQGHIITCSGGTKDGSLRIIRNGVGITEQAVMEMPGITGVWSLRPYYNSPCDDSLVISLIGETRVLRLEEGEELQEVDEYAGFDMSQSTIATRNVVGNLLVQVTQYQVRLIDLNNRKLISQWDPPHNSKITVADINPSQVVIAISGGILIYFQVQGMELVEIKKLQYEIACMSINPLDPIHPESSSIVAVGLWTVVGVQVLRLPSLEIIADQPLEGASMTRSVLISTFENNHYLLAALGDGQLFHFILDPTTGRLSERKQLSLGTQPVMLTSFTSNGLSHVFAASDRPTVIYSSNKKLLYSNVNTKDVTYMCPFKPASMATSLVITHEGGLTIGSIDEIQKLHIRTILLNEMPRRICHQESTHTLGILTIRLNSSDDDENLRYFKILDDQTFEFYDSFEMQPNEDVHSLTSVKFDVKEDSPEYYVVGTSFIVHGENNASKGRILVFQVERNEMICKLRLIHQKEMRGAICSCGPFGGKLLASINGTVTVFEWKTSEDGSAELIPICSNKDFSLALRVVSRGHFVLVGDLFRSISLLAYKESDKDNKSLEVIAKDNIPHWISSVEAFDDDEFIASDTNYDFITFRKNDDTTDEDERRKLETNGFFHLGDSVNQIRHGSLAMNVSETEPVGISSELLYCTSSGAIGVIASIPEQKFKFLKKLEESIDKVIGSIGDLSHKEWRSMRKGKKLYEARGFIDGDLIESFLDRSRSEMVQIAEECDMKVDELLKIVEELTRIH